MPHVLTTQDVARIAYEAHRVYLNTQGDLSRFAWESADVAERADAEAKLQEAIDGNLENNSVENRLFNQVYDSLADLIGTPEEKSAAIAERVAPVENDGLIRPEPATGNEPVLQQPVTEDVAAEVSEADQSTGALADAGKAVRQSQAENAERIIEQNKENTIGAEPAVGDNILNPVAPGENPGATVPDAKHFGAPDGDI